MRIIFGFAAAAFCAPAWAASTLYDFLDVHFGGEVISASEWDGSECAGSCVFGEGDGFGADFRIWLNRAPGDSNPSGSIGDYAGPSFVQWSRATRYFESRELADSRDRVFVEDDAPPRPGRAAGDWYTVADYEEGADSASNRYVVQSLEINVRGFGLLDFVIGDGLVQEFQLLNEFPTVGGGAARFGSRSLDKPLGDLIGQWFNFTIEHVTARPGRCTP